ncbi:MAG: GNAT family N-acetyltransferase [Polyangiaceae bacterium]
MMRLQTSRLELVPMTLQMVEAVMSDRRDDSEAFAHARMPERWPNRELIERAFPVSLDELRADPERRLWGARVMIASAGASIAGADVSQSERRVVGSIVFHDGKPGPDGIAEIAYGVEEGSQRRGYATEGVSACIAWALAQEGVSAVQAATFAWHSASLRVIENVGMKRVGVREHETMGEMLVYERRRAPLGA